MISTTITPTYRSKGRDFARDQKDLFRGPSKLFVGGELFQIRPDFSSIFAPSGIIITVPAWTTVTCDPPGVYYPGGGDNPGEVRYPLTVLGEDGVCQFTAMCEWNANYLGILTKSVHIQRDVQLHLWFFEQPVPPGHEMEAPDPETGEPADIYPFAFSLYIGSWLSKPGLSVRIEQHWLGEPEALLLPTYELEGAFYVHKSSTLRAK